MGVPMDTKISFRTVAWKRKIGPIYTHLLLLPFLDFYKLTTRFFWHVFENYTRCAAIF